MSTVDAASVTTALFVPGDRQERFEKAAASGAGLVVIDLEDAVAPAQKDVARRAVLEALAPSGGALLAAVRINAIADGGVDDLRVLDRVAAGAPERLRAVLIPKAESPGDLATVGSALPGIPLIPLIESAAGLRAVDALARVPGVVRLAFGALDLGADLDATSPALLDHARCTIVLSSRATGLAKPLDSPHPGFRDLAPVRSSAIAARALGFGGQLCIHPSQVRVVADAFLPTSEEREWARRVIATGEGGAAQVDGVMVDRPVLLRAQAILARAGS